MEAIDPTAFLTLEELCAEVTRLGRRHRLVAKGEEISGRTVRFYVEKELLPSVRSGPGKKYPYQTVWQVLFIRLLSTKHGLPLNYLRQTMRDVPVETMRRVVTGEEPLEVANASDAGAAQRHAAQGFQVVSLTGVPERGTDTDDWQVLLDSRDVVLKARADLAPAKLRQLQQVAGLVRSILDDE